MGFNKKYINEDLIRSTIREEGYYSLINVVKKCDSLILTDSFSKIVCDIINKNNNDEIIIQELIELDNLQ